MKLPPPVIPLLFAAALASTACSEHGGDAPDVAFEQPLSVADSLGGSNPDDLSAYAQALEPRELTFPTDHGPHPDFKTEWWYYIGHLDAPDGRRFGYQLTFFRSALTPPSETVEDDDTQTWRTRQLYMAHFALSDLETGAFHSFERFSRGAAGLAGARAEPFRVWLEDWQVEAADTPENWRVEAVAGKVGIQLELAPGKPRVLHGDRGFSRKGETAGAASYYYSRTRMPTRGTVTTGESTFEVTGSSWFDREWSTSLLAPDEVGWDWLGGQFDDGRELMIFRLRRRDGSSARIDGTLVEADGSSRPLRTEGAELTARGTWRSPETGVSYPAPLAIELPAEDLRLEVTPLQPDQELRLSFVYWEGAVSISGSAPGRGYLEMTGYGERASPR